MRGEAPPPKRGDFVLIGLQLVLNPFVSIGRKLRFGTRSGSWSFV